MSLRTKLCILAFALSFSLACGAMENIPCYVDGIKCNDEQKEPVPPTTSTPTTIVGPRGPVGASGRDSTIPGPRGISGAEGSVGVPGQSCSIQDTAYGADITCGSEVVSIFDGSDGLNGIAGQSCSVVDTIAGATVTCGLDSVAILDGENGQDAPFAISEVVDPCSDGPGPDEVILVFATGEWIAWYQGLGLSILTPGATYRTTDQQSCVFTVPN